MKNALKYSLLCSAIGLSGGLSGCAFSKDVLQAGYDHKAESVCDKVYTDPNSIHLPANCRAISDGTYRSKSDIKNDKAKDWK